MIRDCFRNYNYKKHAKLCGVVYGSLFLIDMTVSYVLLKKAFDRLDEKQTREISGNAE